jgi:hypothetical protein
MGLNYEPEDGHKTVWQLDGGHFPEQERYKGIKRDLPVLHEGRPVLHDGRRLSKMCEVRRLVVQDEVREMVPFIGAWVFEICSETPEGHRLTT